MLGNLPVCVRRRIFTFKSGGQRLSFDHHYDNPIGFRVLEYAQNLNLTGGIDVD